MRRIGEIGELTALLKGKYEHVVFYGHGYLLDRGGRAELKLSTACDNLISAQQFADALKGSSDVVDLLIAGCDSNAFAADLTTRLPKIRFGGIQAVRQDTIGGNAKAITEFRIEPRQVKWWGGK